MGEITGKKVLFGFVAGFGVIIGVNATMAYNAIRTFPGLEVKNSYVASQTFDAKRTAQEALEWDVTAQLDQDALMLFVEHEGRIVRPTILSASLGRPTVRTHDQDLVFEQTSAGLRAPIAPVDAGKWTLRLVALAEDGTEFEQQIGLHVSK